MVCVSYDLVEQQEIYDEMLDLMSQQSCVAIDTEFVKVRTLHAQPGLLQFRARGIDRNILVDPLAVSEHGKLAELMENASLIKVLHSMFEDIGLLFRLTGQVPKNVFDTQIACAFLGYGTGLGYQRMVKEVLGKDVDKSEARSDWLARPLSDNQLSYAALDVEYLIEIYRKLSERLKERGLLQAVDEECVRLVKSSLESYFEPEKSYLKLRAGYDLKPVQQKVLQHLVMWRDAQAEKKNIPRPWVLGDSELISLAKTRPKHPKQLPQAGITSYKLIRRYGDTLVQIIRTATNNDESLDNFEMIERPLKGREINVYRQLKDRAKSVAQKNNIAPELLAPKRLLEQLVIQALRHKKQSLPDAFTGWRKPLLAGSFEQVLSRI